MFLQKMDENKQQRNIIREKMWEKVKKYIDTYLNQTYMEALTVFETLLQQSQEIQFLPDKLPTFNSSNTLTKKCPEELQIGVNKYSSISIVILRSIHCNNFTFLLASECLPAMSLSNFIFIAVVWPQQQEMVARWREELSLNMWVTVRQPHKMNRADGVDYLIVRLQNLVIEQGKRWKERPQSVKQKANGLFKNKNFLQALIMYEFALCNNHEIQKSYERAILYGNSAACLYEMRLFSSSILYCNLAIKSDNKYPKGYTRKINCLLELSQYQMIPTTLLKLKSLIGEKEFDYYNEKFTTFMSNDIGIYNWIEIFSLGMGEKAGLKEGKDQGNKQGGSNVTNSNQTTSQQNTNTKYTTNQASTFVTNNKENSQRFHGFGEYHSSKIEIRKTDQGQAYVARQDIYQHELILVNKPMIYFKVSKANKKNFEVILDQVKKNCLLQKSFYETMKLCPPIPQTNQDKNPPKTNEDSQNQFTFNKLNPKQNISFKHPIDTFINTTHQQTITEVELITKLQLSLFMQRFLEELDDDIGYGLWRDTFYFPLNCDGNCSYVHLKTAFTVFATKDIKKGQVLTIDYLADVEALIRSKIMQIKYNRTCSCKYCTLNQWPQNYNGDIKGLFSLIDSMPDTKTKKQMICQIIIKKAQNQEQSQFFDSIFPGIIYKYILFVEKDPHWEDILNLLRILRDQQDPDLSNSLMCCLIGCFNKYLKLPYSTSKQFLELIE